MNAWMTGLDRVAAQYNGDSQLVRKNIRSFTQDDISIQRPCGSKKCL
jgi:hypothetical protein